MSIVIRDAAEEDIGQLADLVAASYRSAFLPIVGAAGLKLRQAPFFSARFERELAHLRVAAEDDGRLLGMHEVRNGHLDMLFLAPDSTGRGVGALLLADAESRGARTLECFAANQGARRFYRRQGWRETSAYEREFAGGTHAFVAMSKP